MPTYEYRCEQCGTTIDVVQSFSDAPLTTCAACEGPLRKVFAPVGIVFKGSGFYKTDSRSGSKRAGSTTPAKGATEGGAAEGPKEGATKKDGQRDAAATAVAPKDGSRDGGPRDGGARDAAGAKRPTGAVAAKPAPKAE